ncbi:hypothetical protein SAMN06295879_0393 [Agreia bicolorata]|uniref:Uncharacterized protein n=1 Tax=Agreia bicolorata TaxID=110935 RepID=A0A1T4WYA8_9MICO|nr:hypothetical protein [Agreia bicolorata]SKA81835.1 hypothetical protein SAMN06295879_0393 [Agreia bicolorata]
MSTPPAPKPQSTSNRTLFIVLGIGGALGLVLSLAAAAAVFTLVIGFMRGADTAGPTPEPSPSSESPGDVDYSDLAFDSDYTLPAGSLAALTFSPPEGTDWVVDPDARNDPDTMSYVSESTGCQLRIWQSSLDAVDVTAGDDETTSRDVASALRKDQVPDDAFAKHTFTGGFSSAKVEFIDLLWGASNSNYLAVRAFGDAGVFMSVGVACTQSSAWDAVKQADAGLGVVTLSE